MLLNPRDMLLVVEWTYASVLGLARPIGARWKAVPMDCEDMRPPMPSEQSFWVGR